MNAEQAYLFKHALHRDAAYQLQLPSARSRLHLLVVDIVESLNGGRPVRPELKAGSEPLLDHHASNALASELAAHAKTARLEASPHGGGQPAGEVELLYLHRAAEHADISYDGAESRRLWNALAELETGARRGEALRRAGSSAFRNGKAREAMPSLACALELALEARDSQLECVARDNIAYVHHMLGNVAESEAEYSRMLALAGTSGIRLRQGTAFGNLANLYLETGRVKEAEELYEKVLAIGRELNDRRLIAISLGNLGLVCIQTGRGEPARQHYLEALAIHREVGNLRSESIVLVNLANLCRDNDQFGQAEVYYEQSLAMQRSMGDRRYEGLVLSNLGSMLLGREDLQRGESKLLQALALTRETANRRSEGLIIGNLGSMLLEMNRAKEARPHFLDAIAIAKQIGNRRGEGLHQCDLARCLIALGEFESARQAWKAGVNILRELIDTNAINTKSRPLRTACEAAGIPMFDDA